MINKIMGVIARLFVIGIVAYVIIEIIRKYFL